MSIQARASHLNQSASQFLVGKLWLKAFLSSLFQTALAVKSSGKNVVPQTVTCSEGDGQDECKPARELRSLVCISLPSQEGAQVFAHLGSVYVVRDGVHSCA